MCICSDPTGRRSLYVNSMTTTAALLAAGAAIETCKNVVEGTVKNAIAVIRPPGHHAEATESMGFCLFNNVGIAARVCQRAYPETCKKVSLYVDNFPHMISSSGILLTPETY